MSIPKKAWACSHNGKNLCVMYAKRLPRKTKKWASLVYEGAGDKATEIVIMSVPLTKWLEQGGDK